MITIDPGHEYIAEHIGTNDDGTLLRFVKNIGLKYPGNTGEPHSGLQCQELIRILIDRTSYLNNQGSCMETENALAALRSALAWFEVRAARCRGDYIDLPHSFSLERERPCHVCGHVGCSRTDRHERLPGTRRDYEYPGQSTCTCGHGLSPGCPIHDRKVNIDTGHEPV